ncbi:MAG: hypothetical protein RL318_3121 [Fibrobacterota bacterium]
MKFKPLKLLKWLFLVGLACTLLGVAALAAFFYFSAVPSTGEPHMSEFQTDARCSEIALAKWDRKLQEQARSGHWRTPFDSLLRDVACRPAAPLKGLTCGGGRIGGEISLRFRDHAGTDWEIELESRNGRWEATSFANVFWLEGQRGYPGD